MIKAHHAVTAFSSSNMLYSNLRYDVVTHSINRRDLTSAYLGIAQYS